MILPDSNPSYGLLWIVAVGVSVYLWSKMYRTRAELVIVYMFGLLCAAIGAKLLYIFAEAHVMVRTEGASWWADPLIWQQVLVGKTIVGALLGGYAGVEWGKKIIGFHEPTGDNFALIVPLGIAIGRVGCLLHGCCPGVACPPAWWTLRDAQGVSYYPAAAGELAFNLVALAVLWFFRRRGLVRHQLFHLYLVSYGLFRFFHEFVRATPRWGIGISAYQLFALLMVFFAVWRYRVRQKQLAQTKPVPIASV